MDKWQKVSQTVRNIGFRTLVFKKYRLPDGSEREFTTYSEPGSQDVAIIAITPDKKVVIAHQFRPGPEQFLDELPGGAVDSGEDLETAARRELVEETGYEATELYYLGSAHRDAYNNSTAHYFITHNCRKTSKQKLGEAEFVSIRKISIEQLIKNALNAKMTDAPAVLMALDRLSGLEV